AVFARGRSAWLIVDLEAKRPRRPEPFVVNIPKNEGLDALSDGAKGLETKHDLIFKACRVAAYSDLDYLGHVNNARYVQWIQDVLDASELSAADSLRLDVNYISEVKAGSSVEIFRGGPDLSTEGNRAYYFEGRRESDSAAVFRAVLSLRGGASRP
ncbi:MAG: acyl-ACP thioesterase, partial [Treponemataceae bacterium]